jgi:hypothetical protein
MEAACTHRPSIIEYQHFGTGGYSLQGVAKLVKFSETQYSHASPRGVKIFILVISTFRYQFG